MNRDIEQLLRESPLKSPSTRLTDRVDAAFEGARALERRWYARPVPLWACALLVAAAAAIGYEARREPAPPRVVYVMPVSPELAQVLTGAASPRQDDFLRRARVSVKTRSDEEF
jgi:hypothetical protein